MAMRDLDAVFNALEHSHFRMRFGLGVREQAYLREQGLTEVVNHAHELVARRLAPEAPPNDGKQTPLRGHPVFIAQHATATCCRSCLAKWLGIQAGKMLSREERLHAIADMLALRKSFPKLDMPEELIRQFAKPPHSPSECVFALTTQTLSADLKTRITPCQFGGNPDCESCGCIASMGLGAIAAHRIGGIIPVGALFRASIGIGARIGGGTGGQTLADSVGELPTVEDELRVLQ